MLEAVRRLYRALVPQRVRLALWTLRQPRPGRLAQRVGRLLAPLVHSGAYLKYFSAWERLGFHVTPSHFYQPIPDARELPESLWSKRYEMTGVDLDEAGQLRLLREAFPRFHDEYRSFPRERTGVPHQYYFANGYFVGADATVLHCMVRHFRPRRVIEIGSGFSTMITAAAALRNGATEVIAIEPHPSDLLRGGFPGLTELVPRKVQDVDPALFATLGEGDILFIDSSHVVKTGSDVSFIYLELLPKLQPGVVVHVHDVFLPAEYPREWVVDKHIFWTEQYLLHAFLAFNSAFRVLFGTAFMAERHPEAMRAAFPEVPWHGGCSFWIQRRPAPADGVPRGD